MEFHLLFFINLYKYYSMLLLLSVRYFGKVNGRKKLHTFFTSFTTFKIKPRAQQNVVKVKQSDCFLKSARATFLYFASAVRSSPLPRNQQDLVLIELCLHSLSDCKDNTISSSRARACKDNTDNTTLAGWTHTVTLRTSLREVCSEVL